MIGLGLTFGINFLLGGLFSTVDVHAQPTNKVPRIGHLGGRGSTPQNYAAFLQGLHDLGYVEGRNVVIEFRDPEGEFERLPALAAELVASKVDVIFAPATPMALAAKQATRTIPIVFVSLDAISSGLVTSLARPDGNLTGLSALVPEVIGKCLEHLKQAVPTVSLKAAKALGLTIPASVLARADQVIDK
jgi:putative ABC transport system substrate-binding protein